MKLVGVQVGTYQGNAFARLHFTEPFYHSECFGFKSWSDKADRRFVDTEIIPKLDDLLDQEVRAYYDSYQRVIDLRKI